MMEAPAVQHRRLPKRRALSPSSLSACADDKEDGPVDDGAGAGDDEQPRDGGAGAAGDAEPLPSRAQVAHGRRVCGDGRSARRAKAEVCGGAAQGVFDGDRRGGAQPRRARRGAQAQGQHALQGGRVRGGDRRVRARSPRPPPQPPASMPPRIHASPHPCLPASMPPRIRCLPVGMPPFLHASLPYASLPPPPPPGCPLRAERGASERARSPVPTPEGRVCAEC